MSYIIFDNKIDFISGKNGYLMMDSESQRLFDIKTYESKLIKQMLQGKSYEMIIEKDKLAKEFIDKLLSMEIAKISESRYVEEKTRIGQLSRDNMISTLNLDTLTIQLPISCNKGCNYCGENLLFGCNMCENFSNNFDSFTYEKILQELKQYQSLNKVIITGGDIFKHYDTVRNFILSIKKIGNIEVSIFNNIDNLNKKIIDDVINCDINLMLLLDLTEKSRDNDIKLFQDKKSLISGLEKNISYFIIANSTEEEIINQMNEFKNVQVQYCYMIKSKDDLRTNQAYNQVIKITNAQQALIRKRLHPCLAGKLAIDSELNVLPCLNMKNIKLSKINLEDFNLFQNYKEIEKYWTLSVRNYENCKLCKYNIACLDCRALEMKYVDENRKVGCLKCEMQEEVK